ncbi:MAG: signal peptidase I [Acidobacteriota bacterium]
MSEVEPKIAADLPEEEKKPTGPPKSVFREYLESFTITLVMAIFGMTFVLQAVTVPTGSMQNTILVGDYLLVNKFIFTPGGYDLPFLPQREIQRGDIIVFKYPGDQKDPRQDASRGLVKYQINYVKRVIGLPGETIQFKNNQVFINGQLLPEYRIIGDQPTLGDDQSALVTREFEDREADDKWSVYYSSETMKQVQNGGNRSNRGFDFGVEGTEMRVPPNSFFAMGDSRDQSDDSRGWGFVPRELIIGRAMFVYWSCDRGASEGMLGCLTHPRLNRIGTFVK